MSRVEKWSEAVKCGRMSGAQVARLSCWWDLRATPWDTLVESARSIQAQIHV